LTTVLEQRGKGRQRRDDGETREAAMGSIAPGAMVIERIQIEPRIASSRKKNAERVNAQL